MTIFAAEGGASPEGRAEAEGGAAVVSAWHHDDGHGHGSDGGGEVVVVGRMVTVGSIPNRNGDESRWGKTG